MKNTEKKEKTQKRGLWGKIMDWYAKPGVQSAVGMIYSLGAAIVIIGALFKIMHWPGAGFMLTSGMLCEALLFTIGIFEKPHVTYHWENIFPFVVGEEAKPINYDGNIGNMVAPMNASTSATVAAPNVNVVTPNTNVATPNANIASNVVVGQTNHNIPNIEISDGDAKSLSDSIKQISKAATQFADISEIVNITKGYKDSLTKATEAAAKFAENQTSLDQASATLISSYGAITEKMNSATESTNSFAEKTVELNKSLSSVNTAYEMHLKEVQNQTTLIGKQSETVNNITTNLDKIHESVDVAKQNMDTYKQMTDQLAKNVADLNSVYGNMLNAVRA